MPIINIKTEDLRLSCSENVDFPLMVCSHERSGTHFLMNSFSEFTHYSNKPYLDFDYVPLGSFLNFFAQDKVYKFFDFLTNLEINSSSTMSINSILKSHFPLSFLGDNYNGKCKIVYIYRNPVDVFISYWKLLHRFNWLEGPKVKSPLDLMSANPCGNSQRYQMQNYTTYFSRWANHVIESYKISLSSQQIVCINYKNLEINFEESMEQICSSLEIPIISVIKRPSRKNYIFGKDLELSQEEKKAIIDFSSKQLQKYPGLPEDLLV